MRPAIAVGMWLTIVTACLFGQQDTALAPDEIFYNGKIITVDSAFSIHEAFAVKGDRFFAIGRNADVRALAGPRTKLVNLAGHTVIPGLMDNHNHEYRYAFWMLRGIDLKGVRSLAEISGRIRQGAAVAREGRTIYATGSWSEAELAEKRAPTREELDRLIPDRPLVILQGRDKAYLNSAALKVARISRETKTLWAEPIPKDANGEPTGVFIGAFPILSLGARLIPIEDIRELILKAEHDQNALGLTSIRDPMVPVEIMRMYWDLWRDKKLTLRVSMGIDVAPGDADNLPDIIGPWGVGPGFGDHWLRIDSVGEFSVDGNSSTNPTPEMFRRGVMTMNRYGWRPAPHIASEKALDVALDAFEAADRERSIRDARWVVEHVPMVRPDQMDRMARLGVLVSAQFQPYPSGGRSGFEGMVQSLGKEQAERLVPMRELLDHHLIVSAGSDWPGRTNNPFVPIYFFVNRKTENGTLAGAAQKISREEALRVSTINNAYTTYEEKIKGSIEPGKLADFLILSADILTVPEEHIRSIYPLATYVGGRKVFESKEGGF